jgi:hypothetical protein
MKSKLINLKYKKFLVAFKMIFLSQSTYLN